MAKSKSKTRTHPARRPSWKGQLSFGLVSFPVEAINALDRERSDIHFHQLHAKCHRRIRYQKVCPVHGELSNDDIVSGYEYQKGKYVEIEPDDLNALRTAADRALKIDAFVTPEMVDPLYFDGRMYYLMPSAAGAAEPYAVIAAAMEQEQRYAVGQVIFSGKKQLVLLRPLDGVLHMAMLNYHAEIRPADKFAADVSKPKNIARQVRLAQTLIEEWSDDNFDFAEYEDDYREKVDELIKAKLRGHKVTAPVDDEEPSEVLNLMDALRKSVGALATSRKTKKRTTRRSA